MKTQHKIVIGDSRRMTEIDVSSVHLVITSPPYWQLKDYGTENQIGFHESYESYINNLNLVWKECFRVLNFAFTSKNKRYQSPLKNLSITTYSLA